VGFGEFPQVSREFCVSGDLRNKFLLLYFIGG